MKYIIEHLKNERTWAASCTGYVGITLHKDTPQEALNGLVELIEELDSNHVIGSQVEAIKDSNHCDLIGGSLIKKGAKGTVQYFDCNLGVVGVEFDDFAGWILNVKLEEEVVLCGV